MDERQKKILKKARELGSNELTLSIIEFADTIAEETLANRITLNGVVIYEKEVK